MRILFGEFGWVFWGLHVGLGTLLPLALLTLWGNRTGAVGLAGLLIAVTFMTVRLNIVIPGLLDPHLRGLQNAFPRSPARLLVCAELVRVAGHDVHRRLRLSPLLPRVPLPAAHGSLDSSRIHLGDSPC